MKKEYDHILFIGAGGGNDMFSTLFAAETMKRSGYTWKSATIAGVLSPFHAYTGLTIVAPSAYTVARDAKRYMTSHARKMEISFVDPAIAALTEDKYVRDLNIDSAVLFDLSLGTNILKEGIMRIAQGGLVVLVDVGGDILYTDSASKEVLSPMFDAMMLSAVKQIEGSVIFLTGAGLDGEISVSRLTAEIRRISRSIIESGLVVKSKDIEKLFLENIKSVRSGNTVPRLLTALKTSSHSVSNNNNKAEAFIEMQHSIRYQVAGNKYYFLKDHYTYFKSAKVVTCKDYYIFYASATENPLAIEYSDTFDWIMNSKVLEGKTNFEGMGQMVRTNNGEIGLLAIPSHFFNNLNTIYQKNTNPVYDDVVDIRKKIILESIPYLSNREVDFLLMYKKDVDLLSHYHGEVPLQIAEVYEDCIIVKLND